MFSAENAFSGFSVDDVQTAKSFYEGVLGLTVTENEMGFINLHLASGAVILVYGKPNHTPASYTVLNFPVNDVDAAVADLAERGVTMEIYEGMPQGTNGVMKGNGPDIAWFTDPAGNVLSILKDD